MTSRQKLTQAGFTLVELAIVLLIVGLLIAGILKGQELIENSRMTATIQQTKSYEAAVNTFRDSFGALPGDIPGALTRVPGCTAAIGCAAGGGDGNVGGTGTVGALMGALSTERAQFWLHLALANLITGIVPDYSTGSPTAAWGTTLPAGRIAGGFLVGFENGTAAVGAATSGSTSGHFITLQNDPATAAGATGGGAITAQRGQQLDRKLDDAQPGTGDVLGMGAANCFTGTGASAVYAAAAASSRSCSLAVRILN